VDRYLHSAARNDPLSFDRGYSKRTVEGAVILRSSGQRHRDDPKAVTRPMPMIEEADGWY
jgi:hypothetical protein